ncbi:unnamed protein product, partial [Symbiodinium microadriaticum]
EKEHARTMALVSEDMEVLREDFAMVSLKLKETQMAMADYQYDMPILQEELKKKTQELENCRRQMNLGIDEVRAELAQYVQLYNKKREEGGVRTTEHDAESLAQDLIMAKMAVAELNNELGLSNAQNRQQSRKIAVLEDKLSKSRIINFFQA